MKMSADENESVDIQLINWRSNNSSRIDLEEELNRMERPSRVFNSHHHLSMPPVLTDTINMEQNEQVRSSRDNSYDESLSSTTQNAGRNTVNGDATRNRSPFVRFTITDSDTQQITAARQIPLNNTPPNTQTSSLTLSNEVASVSMNDESEEDDTRSGLNLTFWRKDIVLRHVGYDHRPEHARSVRRPRKFADQPYVLINRSFPRNTSSGVTRRTNRLVNVSSTNQGYNDHPPGRSQTPEQELPEVQVIENVMEPDNSDDQYDVYRARGQEGILSVSSRNDADSGEDRGSSHEENRNSTLDIPNETPRTRVVPFIMSPTPFSPPSESPTDASEILATGVNNDLPNVPAAIPLTTNNDDNHNTVSNNESRTSLVRVEEHPETYEDLNGQLLRLFECPVCFEHIISPIYQCLHGHLICNKCIVMCENCPTCRNYFNTQRNLYMEKVGNLLKFPCKNTSYGCKQQMFISLKENHEQECLCRQYQCFFTDCSWKGYYSELHSHMIKNHNNYVLTGSEQFLDIVLNGENQTLKWFLSGESEYFAILIHVMESPRILKIQVNLIGPAVKAKKFKFCVQLTQRKKRSGFSQKLVYESSTLSFSEIDDALNHSGLKQNLISLSEEMIEPFIRRRTNCRLPVIFKVIPV